MGADHETAVLHLFEAALAQPADARLAWLQAQAAPAAVVDRVHRLLQAEQALGGFLETPPMPELAAPGFPQIGERLGSWELVEQLDAGGMGVVYRARRADSSYDQDVAIKLIRPVHLLAEPAVRQQLFDRFDNERRLLARLNHPNVARILDGGSTASGIPYLVMEYVDGRSLTDHCRDGALSVPQRLRLFARVCDGVQEAHRHLIVHRDLKPENVLVGADGEPRLLDFGIARTLEQVTPDATGVATTLTAMTPAYASPEQVAHRPLTTSSDVYSLGVMLYQLLTDVRPYELAGMSPAQAQHTVCESAVPGMLQALERADLTPAERRRRRQGLGPDLQRIVAKAMHKEPGRRYASAQALAEDIRRCLEGRPVLAHPDSAGYRMAKFLRRHRLGSAAAALALVLVVAAAAIAMAQARYARQAAADTAQVNAFLNDVLKISDPYTQGSEIPLSQALDEAAGKLDERFGDRPDLAAGIRLALGISMASRFRLEPAEQQIERALAESEAAFGTDHLDTVRALETLAGLRLEQGRKAEAQALFQDSLRRLERSGQTGNPFYGIVLNNLGMFHLTNENYAEARTYLERSLPVLAAPAAALTVADRANSLSNLAQAEHGLGANARADALYQQAQALLEAEFPDGHPDLAILLNNRALLLEDSGQPQAALDMHLASVAMRRRAFGARHAMIVVALTNAARQALAVGKGELALALAGEAASMADVVYAEPTGRQVIAHAVHAQAQLDQGAAGPAWSSWDRARTLVERVEAPVPSVGTELERARDALCRSAPQPEACAAATPRT
jgi:serine/threonine-protein kinase